MRRDRRHIMRSVVMIDVLNPRRIRLSRSRRDSDAQINDLNILKFPKTPAHKGHLSGTSSEVRHYGRKFTITDPGRSCSCERAHSTIRRFWLSRKYFHTLKV